MDKFSLLTVQQLPEDETDQGQTWSSIHDLWDSLWGVSTSRPLACQCWCVHCFLFLQLSFIGVGYTRTTHPKGVASTLLNQEMRGTAEKARRQVRLWIYVLAEFIPQTRQRLCLPLAPPTEREPSCGCSVTLDATTTRTLLDECLSRGVSLDSVLLASLFLAAAEAVRVERTSVASRRGGDAAARPFAIRAQRGVVLGLVCVVMALLSGSAESKAMRYFCSVYAVIAGTLC